jgi:prepilin-type N-terminal cleavage/methylation domain-containing protein
MLPPTFQNRLALERDCRHGFSLIELLVVMGIITILVALMAPAISGFSSTSGRRGAVNIVMNTIDQARVAALEQGREVQVVFWRRESPEADSIKLRRKTDTGWEELTKWIKLPRGVLLHNPPSRNVFHSQSEVDLNGLTGAPPLSQLGAIEFTASGTVRVPRTSEDSLVILTEGTRESEESISQRKEQSGGFEIISVARYTGRPTLVVSELKALSSPQG